MVQTSGTHLKVLTHRQREDLHMSFPFRTRKTIHFPTKKLLQLDSATLRPLNDAPDQANAMKRVALYHSEAFHHCSVSTSGKSR